MAQGKLHSQDYQIQFKQGVEADINTDVTKNLAVEGEPHWTTDTDTLYVFDGTKNRQAGMKVTSSAADPSTTELPEDGNFCIHKNTTTGYVYLAYNDGGTIKKVQLA